jgi:osmotically-inducible protein OsmY
LSNNSPEESTPKENKKSTAPEDKSVQMSGKEQISNNEKLGEKVGPKSYFRNQTITTRWVQKKNMKKKIIKS